MADKSKLTERLKTAEQAYEEATRARKKAILERQKAIEDAVEAGLTYREIGEAMGITRSRAHQILISELAND